MKKERGAFLIIFCMILTLLIFVSLAVLDISNQRTKADRARYYTKLATLKALDAYFRAWDERDDDGKLLYDCKNNDKKCRDVAVKAANDYLIHSDTNHSVFDSTEERGDKKNYDVGNAGEHYAHNKIREDVDPKEGLNIVFGHWVNCRNDSEKCFSECSSSSSFACSAFSSNNEGRSESSQSDSEEEVEVLSDSPEQFFLTREEYKREFVRIHGTEIGIGNPNAVVVKGKWLQDNKTYALSGLLSGGTRIAPTISATAMVVPRHVYFVVDISRSGEMDNFPRDLNENRFVHCNENEACRRGNVDEAVDLMIAVNPKRDLSNDQDPDHYYMSDYVRKVTFGDADYEDLPEKERIIHPSPSEYSLHLTKTGTSWGSLDSDRNSFYVHAFNPRGEGYPKPKPLVSIIQAVHKAIGTLKDRKVTGDKAGVVFFTNGLVWPRITKLTSDLDTLYEFTDYQGQLNVANGMVLENDEDDNGNRTKTTGRLNYSVSQLLNGESGLGRAIRYSILPVPAYEFPPESGNFDTWGFSNITEALNLALKYINEVDCPKDIHGRCVKNYQLDPNVSRSIVLFTDGVQNCRVKREEGSSGYECHPTDIDYYNDGIEDIKQLVLEGDNSMRKKNIPLHIFQAGSDVAPHTMAIRKDELGVACFTDAECRVSKECNPEAFVSANDSDKEAVCAYAYATGDSALIRLAEESGSPCGEQVPFYNASYEMYHLALGTGGVYVPLRDRDPAICGNEKCDIDMKCRDPNCSGKQRITTDLQCRTLERQIQDGMDEAVGVNPYRIVDVE